MKKPFTFRSPRLVWLSAACVLFSLASFARSQETSAAGTKAPSLSGSFSDLAVKLSKSGKSVKVGGLLTLLNSGTKAAKDVTATVYLSSDATLDSADTKLVVLDLASFFDGDGKLGKNSQTTIPLKYKLPTLLAPALSGQYVIIALAADNAPAGADSTLIVVGPLPSVP